MGVVGGGGGLREGGWRGEVINTRAVRVVILVRDTPSRLVCPNCKVL